jgi:hypothetical protein
VPVGRGVLAVKGHLPCGDLLGQAFLVGNAAGEALAGQHAEFAFSHVQPTAVLGRVVPFEPLDEAAGLLGRENFIERGGLVGT